MNFTIVKTKFRDLAHCAVHIESHETLREFYRESKANGAVTWLN